MTSAVGGGRGSPKSRQKEHGCLNSVCDKGGGVKNPKILRTSYKYRPFHEAHSGGFKADLPREVYRLVNHDRLVIGSDCSRSLLGVDYHATDYVRHCCTVD